MYQDPARIFAPVESLKKTILFAGLVILLIFLPTAIVLGGRIMKPVLDVASTAKEIALGNLEERARVVGNDEVALLSTSFNSMVDALAESRASFHNIVEKMHDGTIVVRPDGVVGYASPSAKVLLGDSLQTGGEFKFSLAPGKIEEVEEAGLDGERRTLEMYRQENEWAGSDSTLVTVRDITNRKQLAGILTTLVEASSAKFGKEFFNSTAVQLSILLDMDYVIIGELQEGARDKIRTLSFAVDGEIAENFEYDLLGSPCEHAIEKKACSYLSGVAEQFPDAWTSISPMATGSKRCRKYKNPPRNPKSSS